MRDFIILFIIVIIIVAFIIAITSNLNLQKGEDAKTLTKETFGWVKQVGINMKNTAGFVLSQNWEPKINVSQTKENSSK